MGMFPSPAAFCAWGRGVRTRAGWALCVVSAAWLDRGWSPPQTHHTACLMLQRRSLPRIDGGSEEGSVLQAKVSPCFPLLLWDPSAGLCPVPAHLVHTGSVNGAQAVPVGRAVLRALITDRGKKSRPALAAATAKSTKAGLCRLAALKTHTAEAGGTSGGPWSNPCLSRVGWSRLSSVTEPWNGLCWDGS